MVGEKGHGGGGWGTRDTRLLERHVAKLGEKKLWGWEVRGCRGVGGAGAARISRPSTLIMLI